VKEWASDWRGQSDGFVVSSFAPADFDRRDLPGEAGNQQPVALAAPVG